MNPGGEDEPNTLVSDSGLVQLVKERSEHLCCRSWTGNVADHDRHVTTSVDELGQTWSTDWLSESCADCREFVPNFVPNHLTRIGLEDPSQRSIRDTYILSAGAVLQVEGRQLLTPSLLFRVPTAHRAARQRLLHLYYHVRSGVK